MSLFNSTDNNVDYFYHKLELASSAAIPLKTSIRTNTPFPKKNSRLKDQLYIPLNNHKKFFIERKHGLVNKRLI